MYFLRYISNQYIKFEIVNSKLKIKEWPKEFQKPVKVLIIGHENEFKFHRLLINVIIQNNLFDIAFKLHPRQTSKIKNQNLWIIYNKEDIPKSDYVISYGSTLDSEIEVISPDIKFIHYSSSPKFDYQNEINKIKNKLKLEIINSGNYNFI